jgi:hypothetical protein
MQDRVCCSAVVVAVIVLVMPLACGGRREKRGASNLFPFLVRALFHFSPIDATVLLTETPCP